jgi:hypothetical protein
MSGTLLTGLSWMATGRRKPGSHVAHNVRHLGGTEEAMSRFGRAGACEKTRDGT